MAAEGEEEFPVAGIPELDGVVEGGGSDERAVGGESDVVDGFLVAEEAGEGFRVGGFPEVDGEVVACGHETFGDAVIHGCGFGETFFCSSYLSCVCSGDVAGVVVVGCAEDEVGGEGEVVDPVGVGGEGGDEGALCGVPEFDRFIVGGGVDCSGAAPADAGDGGFVAGEDKVDAFGDGVPDADGSVFGAGCEALGGGVLLAQVVGFPGEAVDPFGVAL